MVIAALLVATAHGGCSERVDPDELSMIWISLDTLRADHLGVYGYERDTSPFLDGLAREGLYFEWAISPQNSTLPSHMTMFTGRHPVVHGIMYSKERPGLRLAPAVPTLGTVLSDAGFETRAWVDGGKMRGLFGFARGFDSYDDQPTAFPRQLAAAKEALRRSGDQRFFYLIHTYEIHYPYNPEPPYRARYPPADGSEHELARTLYDGSIRFVDDHLEKFVGELRELGFLDRTILVITSDHGESFHEYGIAHTGHVGFNLHQNITRVPWIMLHPDRRLRGPISEPVGLIDFANTTFGLLGVEERFSGGGVDVFAAPREPRSYVSWTGAHSRNERTLEAWSFYRDGYHLLAAPAFPRSRSRNALYRVAVDPREQDPLEPEEPAAARLQVELSSAREALARDRQAWAESLHDASEIPNEVRDELRALGYLDDEAN